jgi:hypothetical protein
MQAQRLACPVRAVTRGPRSHFFGYYEKTPWDVSGRYVLSLETTVPGHRMPGPGEWATVGVVDLHDGDRFTPLKTTRAWNWQQGCMLQWLPGGSPTRFVYNDRFDDKLVSVIRDRVTDDQEVLPRPVYNVARSGAFAVGLTFARMHRWRPVTGYAGVRDASVDDHCPADDGIFRIDIATGDAHLILSLADVARASPHPSATNVGHWIEHLQLSPDDRRIAFIHRWVPAGAPTFCSRLFTVDAADGSDLRLLADEGKVSHYDWRDADHLLAWTRAAGRDAFHLYTDRPRAAVEPFAHGVLTRDGHCTFSPDGRWVLTDTYPDEDRNIPVLLYRPTDGRLVEVGRFLSPPEMTGATRCDLHPRWSRDGRTVCIDSAHDQGTRQVYLIDVGGIVA